MTTHPVVQGECVAQIASKNKLTWRQIGDAPGNAELRAKRKAPDVLYPGDELVLPAASRPSVPLTLDATTTVVRRKAGCCPFRLAVVDVAGAPLANADYTLTLGSETRNGKTDANGRVRE